MGTLSIWARWFSRFCRLRSLGQQQPFISPSTDHKTCGKLCSRCRKLGLGQEFFYCELSEDDEDKYGVRVFDFEDRDDGLLVTQDYIRNLTKTSRCLFCQLILCAIEEQYQSDDRSVMPSHQYRLEWRHVPCKIKRHAEDDNWYVRYIQVLSPANCKDEYLERGQFIFRSHPFKREVIRSLIAPVSVGNASEQFLMGRDVRSKIDIQLLKRWMQSCENSHGDQCNEPTGEITKSLPSPFFMVVDVKNMCLSAPSTPYRYITLSYVWGGKGQNSFLTTNSNVGHLRRNRALMDFWNLLPRTVQDAITLVQELGERYLWIDSLCIIQDDVISKETNIKTMNLVYTRALFTIVAASGESASAGLPGVQPDSRRRHQRRRTLNDQTQFMLVDDLEFALDNCTWVTRAWTFQEWSLTSRCLIFFDSQVVFSCRYATWCEDIVGESGPRRELVELNDVDFSYLSLDYELRPHRRFLLQSNLQKDIGGILERTLREYLQRQLTYESDVLNAFQGILDYFAVVLRSSTVMGAIVRILDWAILFWTGSERREQFPSWTWCGWIGPLLWLPVSDGDILGWISQQTWIIWHHRGLDPESITRIERDQTVTWNMTEEVSAKSLTDDWNELYFAEQVQRHMFKYQRKTDATPSKLPAGPPCNPNIAKNNGFLQFWTLSLPLMFDYPSKFGKLKLYDRDGVPCGSVLLDSVLDPTTVMRHCELIVLSEARWCIGVKESYLDHRDRKSTRDQARRILDGQLNVMLIAWNGAFAERLSIGEVWQETVNYLDEPRMIWKEIILR